LFGFGQNKKRTEEKIQWAQDAAYKVLMAQADQAGASEQGTSQKRLVTNYAFGYIFGFAGALMQRAGVTDDVKIMAQLMLVYTSLFGIDKGSKIFGACLRRQSEPDFASGRKVGGSEALKWLSSGGKWVPSGLMFYLMDSALSQGPRAPSEP